ANQRGGRGVENNKAIVAFGGRHVPLITQPHFQHQSGPDLIVVLHKESERTLGNAARLTTQRDAERVGSAREESGHSGKVKTARARSEIVIKKLAEFPSGF